MSKIELAFSGIIFAFTFLFFSGNKKDLTYEEEVAKIETKINTVESKLDTVLLIITKDEREYK